MKKKRREFARFYCTYSAFSSPLDLDGPEGAVLRAAKATPAALADLERVREAIEQGRAVAALDGNGQARDLPGRAEYVADALGVAVVAMDAINTNELLEQYLYNVYLRTGGEEDFSGLLEDFRVRALELAIIARATAEWVKAERLEHPPEPRRAGRPKSEASQAHAVELAAEWVERWQAAGGLKCGKRWGKVAFGPPARGSRRKVSFSDAVHAVVKLCGAGMSKGTVWKRLYGE